MDDSHSLQSTHSTHSVNDAWLPVEVLKSQSQRTSIPANNGRLRLSYYVHKDTRLDLSTAFVEAI